MDDRSFPDDDSAAVLDADIVDLLNDAVAAPPSPLDQLSLQRVKRRVLARIAEAQTTRHLTVRADEGQWQPFGPGLTMKVLHESGGIMSYLVRLAPGAALPPHRHPVDEECLVLEGSLRVGDLVVGPGGFHLGRQDVLHMRVESDSGALIYLRGAVPDNSMLI
ncbi:cupin domain-containing protein [Aquincola sp. S2]|uniref:Cupin domain-containing protein n=1 Tax=Pseudaquabacterium terrae TaxID=2732868 RepID=A0ABX2EJP7_9BURK|nr:cupin domain-containing protein [Aquabacterium terrae]NRF68834.1 cupin domain-containing protein [Aquabacterium terrae]